MLSVKIYSRYCLIKIQCRSWLYQIFNHFNLQGIANKKIIISNSYECNYNEIIELNLDDDFLRNNMEEDFSVSFNSKEANNKITFTSPYLKGYLSVAY